jgi:adenylate cyclase
MGREIERKFLVVDTSAAAAVPGVRIRQGYLSTVPERTVRVRRAGDRAFVTIKGRSTRLTRDEFEYEIPPSDADELLDRLCEQPLVEKSRHVVEHGGRRWEVDVFEGDNAGLVVAEVELPAEDAQVAIPRWVGREVSADPRYLNANLVRRPFRTWDEDGA